MISCTSAVGAGPDALAQWSAGGGRETADFGERCQAARRLLRDVEHVVGVILMMLFYATPILYPVSIVPPALRDWMRASPLGWYSERLREVLLQGSGLVWGDGAMALACVAIFLVGLWVFERLSPHF